jgi:NAD(P)-dependent dehydrogenase (short-subunit alcohol dehydrogenase family)
MPIFTDKVALVTGAASGIGEATAIPLASDGAFVWCADLDPIAAERVIGTLCLPANDAASSVNGAGYLVD